MEGSQKSKNVMLFPLEGVSRLPLVFLQIFSNHPESFPGCQSLFAHNLPTAKRRKN